jgi:hypothetical protein
VSEDPRYLGEGEAWVPASPGPESATPPPSSAPSLETPRVPADQSPPIEARSEGQVRISGIARSVERRREQDTESLRFRLDVYDPQSGNRVQSYGVEMSGAAIGGGVGENEPVRVTGRFAGGTLLADEIYDVQTGATITPLGPAEAFHRRFGRRKALTGGYLVAMGVVAAVVVTVFVIIVISLIGDATKKVDLPNVVGIPAGQAQFRLAEAGIGSNHVRVDGNVFCRVISQDPAAGSKVSPDSTVTLVARPTGANNPVGCQ